MRRGPQFWIGVAALGMLFGIIAWYAYYRSENFIKGPIITIASPQNDVTVTDPHLSITGNVKNATSVTLDDRKIFLDEQGNFDEQLLIAPGYTIITLKAEDQFHRSAEKQVEVLLGGSGTDSDVSTTTSSSM